MIKGVIRIMEIGEKIKAARISANMTQAELAEKLGIAYQNIGQIESGKRKPKLETVVKIAYALGCRFEDLVGLETFNTGAEFDECWKALEEKSNRESVTVIHATDPRKFIDFALDQMTEEGQTKVAERAAEVLEVPRYRKDAPKD